MTSSIVVNFWQASFNSPSPSIQVTTGQFVLSEDAYLSVAGGIAPGTVTISSSSISFLVPDAPAPTEGSVMIPLVPTPGYDPSVTVTGFTGIVRLSWPTANGQGQTVDVQSGDPVVLADYPQ